MKRPWIATAALGFALSTLPFSLSIDEAGIPDVTRARDAQAAKPEFDPGRFLRMPKVRVQEFALDSGGSNPGSNAENSGPQQISIKGRLRKIGMAVTEVTGSAGPVLVSAPDTPIPGDYGTLYTNSDGSFHYILQSAAPHSSDSPVIESFDLSILSGNGEAGTAILPIEIYDDLPQANDDSYEVPASETTTIAAAEGLLKNDDPGADGASVQPQNGSHAIGNVDIAADGSLQVTVAVGVTGSAVIPYELLDGDGDSSLANVTIAVKNDGALIADVPPAMVDEAALDSDDVAAGDDIGSNPASTGEHSGEKTILFSGGTGNVSITSVTFGSSETPVPAGDVVVMIAGAFGNLEIFPDGRFSYHLTDNADHSAGPVSESFAFAMADEGGKTGNGNIDVVIGDDTAQAVGAPYNVDAGNSVGESATNGLLVIGTPGADGGRVTDAGGQAVPDGGSSVVTTALGMLTMNSDGGFSYSANANVSGPDNVAFTIEDTDGDSSGASLDFTVQNGQPSGNFTTVSGADWDEPAVRKVMHLFAYGGFADDNQITTWANMDPDAAIAEILTFDPVNPLLSPPEDDTAGKGASLEELQNFWSSNQPGNPVIPAERDEYAALNSSGSLSDSNLQDTWIQAGNTRGINPFLHRMGLFLTNYHMSLHLSRLTPALMRDHYDDTLASLQFGSDFITVIGEAAAGAPTARQYLHQFNTFNNGNGEFRGNDDFAREYHQLYFRINGDLEDPDYHENVTIENTARVLTGMNLDRIPGANGSSASGDWWVSPIDFSDHTDADGRTINNLSNHHQNCLEIYNDGVNLPNVCGATAEDKIFDLAAIAGSHEESLDNLPVYIIGHFADDNLNDEKINNIRGAWRAMAQKDILVFLRAYAVSTTFHRSDTVKYKTAFTRNHIIQNLNTLTNEESFARARTPQRRMRDQGVEVFEPVHFVFGHQTGFDAANSPDILKNAYAANVLDGNFLRDADHTYVNGFGQEQTWLKDWGGVIPTNTAGEHVVADVADWLWQRFMADGGGNFDPIARAQVQSLLATGRDFGYQVSQSVAGADPETVYGSDEIQNDAALQAIVAGHAATIMDLNSSDPAVQEIQNERIGYAVNFMTALPFSFALEGK
jgi:hypothetical protein